MKPNASECEKTANENENSSSHFTEGNLAMSLGNVVKLPAETPLGWRLPTVREPVGHTVVITARMKYPLKKRLDERAKKEGISLNQLCVHALTMLCDHLDATDEKKGAVTA